MDEKTPSKRKLGRPPVGEHKRKRNYTVTLTEGEHSKLERLAESAGENKSEYIISQLKLNK